MNQMMPWPPDEDEVVEALCNFLTQHGWTITERSPAGRPGLDLAAIKDAQRLAVEAKGLRRKGSPEAPEFARATKCRNAYYALAQACTNFRKHPGWRIAIAVPKDESGTYESFISEDLSRALEKLDCAVFWILPGGKVREWNAPWL